MNIRVQRADGSFECIELRQDAWQVLRLGTINSLVSGDRTHSFDEDGYYLPTEAVRAEGDREAPPDRGADGLEPSFA